MKRLDMTIFDDDVLAVWECFVGLELWLAPSSSGDSHVWRPTVVFWGRFLLSPDFSVIFLGSDHFQLNTDDFSLQLKLDSNDADSTDRPRD